MLAFSTCAILLAPPSLKAFSQTAANDQKRLLEVKVLSINILRVERMLNREDIPIEAGLLFTPTGRHKLRDRLGSYPDISMSKVGPRALAGVWMANRLTIPERSELQDDTLIIANHITFSGSAPTVSGPYDFHLFALDSISLDDPQAVITIDTSGALGADGVVGMPGKSGQTGVNGVAGKGGSCSTVLESQVGGAGTDGTPGEDGGSGTPGRDGTNAGHQTIMFGSASNVVFNLIANGGNGGGGGPGGAGGDGGSGGSGGLGGNGPGCNCDGASLGDAGTGGAGGHGGIAGAGGQGGDGGSGGNAGNIVFTFPSTYNNSKVNITARGGSGGQAGIGGSAGISGSAGNPGAGGQACGKGRNGSMGRSANGSVGRNGANPGTPGSPGQSGSIVQNVADFKNGTGRVSSAYEPGITREACTEWYSASIFIGCY